MSKKYSVLHPFSFMPNLENKTEEDIKNIYTYLEQGKGCWVHDNLGKKYFYGTTAVPTVGLGNNRIINAMNKQLEKLSFGSTCGQTHELLQPLGKKLIDLTKNQFSLTFFSNDGSGSVETAMKLTRQYFNMLGLEGKSHFISLNGNYHGTTLASGSITNLGIKENFGDALHNCLSAPFPNMLRPPIEGTEEDIIKYCLNQLKNMIDEVQPENIGALIIEPVQGVNGVIPLPKTYLKEVEILAKKNNILLITDEVTTGLGRTGYWTASEYYDIQPDLLTISKGLTGGYFPMGVTLISEKIENVLLKDGGIFLHGSTQCGHPVGCAAALELISIIEDESLLENAKEIGQYIKSNLTSNLSDVSCVGDIRGLGMMISIEFVTDKQTKKPINFEMGECFSREISNYGVLGNYFNSIFLLYPPLNTTLDEANFVIDSITKAIKKVFN
ncbi:aminotransferase class III-fold pyridoxal phosphate-dependent enzyme [Bacillus sp. SM2101]|uniref:aminotransferase family protein n=1 Tax=Bacillus sp. SM2101 TaxID=2805366 RepID=UPI001BDF0665|nr:aminotransferase class III-fold pyridoxal phosphate-dependent enzyme [Bacillus sp. SM2101]